MDAQTERRVRPAAEAGDPAAMNVLELFLSERGEPDEALQWYQRAVDAGNVPALNNAGLLTQNRGDTDAAVQWFRRAADAGSVLAMVNLGNLAMGRSDRAEAERWFRRAVDAGPQRRDVEGFRLFEAPGGPTPAEQRWTRAGDDAHVAAMCGMGELRYRRGELSDAETWWRRAAAAGSSVAEENLRRLRSRRSVRHGFGSSDYGGGHYGGHDSGGHSGGFGGSW